jgi:hypothetical protein
MSSRLFLTRTLWTRISSQYSCVSLFNYQQNIIFVLFLVSLYTCIELMRLGLPFVCCRLYDRVRLTVAGGKDIQMDHFSWRKDMRFIIRFHNRKEIIIILKFCILYNNNWIISNFEGFCVYSIYCVEEGASDNDEDCYAIIKLLDT